ncbi:MAG: hypothetical protein WCC11_04255 [Gammaproteobacteria bacterium]
MNQKTVEYESIHDTSTVGPKNAFFVLFSVSGWGGSDAAGQYLAYFYPPNAGLFTPREEYVLQDFILVGGNGWRWLHLKSIKGDVITLSGKKDGPNDWCCPTIPITVGLTFRNGRFEYLNKDDVIHANR